MFLDSGDKSLNMWKFCRNDQREGNNKRRTKGAPLLRNPLSLLSCTVWPRNDNIFGLHIKPCKTTCYAKKLMHM